MCIGSVNSLAMQRPWKVAAMAETHPFHTNNPRETQWLGWLPFSQFFVLQSHGGPSKCTFVFSSDGVVSFFIRWHFVRHVLYASCARKVRTRVHFSFCNHIATSTTTNIIIIVVVDEMRAKLVSQQLCVRVHLWQFSVFPAP